MEGFWEMRRSYDTLEQWMLGEPICVRTLSSHCRGPLRCSSIQQGVLVTVWRLRSAESCHYWQLFIIDHNTNKSRTCDIVSVASYSWCRGTVDGFLHWRIDTDADYAGFFWSHSLWTRHVFSSEFGARYLTHPHPWQCSGNPPCKGCVKCVHLPRHVPCILPPLHKTLLLTHSCRSFTLTSSFPILLLSQTYKYLDYRGRSCHFLCGEMVS